MMNYKRGGGGSVDVKGRFRIQFGNDGGGQNDSDDEDDDDEDMWLDYSSDGGGRVRSKKPKLKNLSIVNENGKSHACKGRFPLTELYWTVQAKIKNTWLQAPPAYSIEQDSGSKQIHVQLFLDDCFKTLRKDVAASKDVIRSCFEIFCSENLGHEGLTFFNLESALKAYMMSEKESCGYKVHYGNNPMGKKDPGNHDVHIQSAVFKSGLGSTVLRAVSHPKLVECVSKLLPYSFQDCLCKLHPTKLQVAQTMATASPWEFAFRQILFNKLRLSGTEAYLWAYEKGGYLPLTPVREKDALYIYEVLKLDAQKFGHMYMPFRRILCSQLFAKLDHKITTMDRWKSALDYMDENDVIVREEFDQDVNIFLHHNWKAEVDAVQGFETVISEYKPEVDDMDVDLDSSDFDKVRSDREQLKASGFISRLPVVVLSGMGGCGKTTVVTNLLKHVCDRYEKQLAKLKEERLRKQLEESSIDDGENDQTLGSTQCDNEESTRSISEEATASRQEAIEDGNGNDDDEGVNVNSGDGEMEGETELSYVVENESKQGRLRRELKEDLLKILREKKDEDSDEMKSFKRQILLVAPTGKAARLLGCKARLPSATIHSVVMSWRLWRDNKDKEEVPKEWTYSCVKILVMDECSLVSVRLFAAIVSILLEHAQLSKLVLLGDIKQLPSIEPGDFLKDIFRAFSRPSFGFSVELTENHRSESTLIVENAKRISRHQLPTFDPEQRFHFIELEEGGDDNERDQVINDLLRHNQDIQCQVGSQFVSFRNAHCRAINELCAKYYNSHSLFIKRDDSKEVMHFEPGDKICLGKNQRVINQEKFLDGYIAEIRHLLGDNDKLPKSVGKPNKSSLLNNSDLNRTKAGLSAAEVTSLFAGDEGDLDQTVNDLRQQEAKTATTRREQRLARAAQRKKEWKEKHDKAGNASQETEKKETKKTSPNEEKLCNGEVFFIMDEYEEITQDGKHVKYLILSDRDPVLPRVVCVLERTLRKDCKMKHSWVRTIHTYQGSESETVVYILGPAIPQNWQHVYTAVTRGKKSVYIVGKRRELGIAVERQSFPRYSHLRQRLNDMLIRQTENVEKVKSGKKCKSEHDDDDQNSTLLTQSFESSDDSWILSSMPDPYFTQTTDAGPSIATDIHGKEEVYHTNEPTPSLTLKHSKVLNNQRKNNMRSLVVKGDTDDVDTTTCDVDFNVEVDNSYHEARVPSLHDDDGGVDHSNKPTQSFPSQDETESNHFTLMRDRGASSSSSATFNVSNNCHTPRKKLTLKSSSSSSAAAAASPSPSTSGMRTPKKTPPRASTSSFHDFQSPPKQACVDTPFRDSFQSSLSLDPHWEGGEEDPIPSTPPRDRIKRKIL